MTEADPPASQDNNNNTNTYLRVVKIRFQGSGVRLIKVRSHGKEPLEKNWTVGTYSFEDHRILGHIHNGGNYGITSVDGSYVAVDADTREIQDALDTRLPSTFRYSTGKNGHFQYWYAIEDPPIGCIPLKDGAYIKGKGGMVVGPGSVHPNGTIYGSGEIRDAPIATVTKAQLFDALSEFLVKPSNSNKQREGGGAKNVRILRKKEVTADQVEELISELTSTWARANHLRHVLTLSIIGTCEKRRWDQKSVEGVVEGLIMRTGVGQEHLIQVKYAWGKSGRKYGIPTLTKIMEAVQNDRN